MLSKVVSTSIFKVFGMTRPGIEPRSPGPLANTLTAGPMSSLPFKTIRELVHSCSQCNRFSDTGVYCIYCKNCKLKYIGGTSRNLHVCLKEHKRDIRIGNLNIALFQHISQSNHNFDFNSAKMLIYIHNKRLRQIFCCYFAL